MLFPERFGRCARSAVVQRELGELVVLCNTVQRQTAL